MRPTMSTLNDLIRTARDHGASDVHLEAGLPAALRISSDLRTAGEPLSADALKAMAHEIIDTDAWPHFLERGSFDLSRVIEGVRCRINVLHSARGIGFAIRLLSSNQVTVEKLNLHPDLKKLAALPHGLILVSGPTGSGKSSTMAALIQEVNQTSARHIITIEQPIEYQIRPIASFVRQREVGRDTPSFEQALIDALREDPDVLMVGEMREPETMRLTLNASETGHLVMATIHSSSAVEALQRMILAFPSEIQNSVAAQLADSLSAVICQRLRFEPNLGIRIPECEVLRPTHAVKNFIRRLEFHQIASLLETGAEHGMWTFARYRNWMSAKKDWYIPSKSAAAESAEDLPRAKNTIAQATKPAEQTAAKKSPASPALKKDTSGRIEIVPEDLGFGKILKPGK
ncbi:MAG TPA: PilT/PilU family type 4a pilus ATPase [Verrucomicrobiae bacterium]|nr:PilT/PilU family type 4a pilus ATPase [Verrucomicrobiae bacterium]